MVCEVIGACGVAALNFPFSSIPMTVTPVFSRIFDWARVLPANFVYFAGISEMIRSSKRPMTLAVRPTPKALWARDSPSRVVN